MIVLSQNGTTIIFEKDKFLILTGLVLRSYALIKLCITASRISADFLLHCFSIIIFSITVHVCLHNFKIKSATATRWRRVLNLLLSQNCFMFRRGCTLPASIGRCCLSKSLWRVLNFQNLSCPS